MIWPVLVLVSMCSAVPEFIEDIYDVKRDQAIIGSATVIGTFMMITLTECTAACNLDIICCSASYDEAIKMCAMNSDCNPSTHYSVGNAVIGKFQTQALGGPIDCSDIPNSPTGVFMIYPDGTNGIQVYCHEGWTVFQRRIDGITDFYRPWQDYKVGFGDINGEYWLGNDNLNILTFGRFNRLRVILKDFNNAEAEAIYSTFYIGDESSNYTLTVSGYSGTAGDGMIDNDGQMFTTFDRDNDILSSGNCAVNRYGAWWHFHCTWSNLNGKYEQGLTAVDAMSWNQWKNNYECLQSTMMMIKP